MFPRILLSGLVLAAAVAPAGAWEVLYAPGPGEYDNTFGNSVCEVGDVDGNGLGDFVVGDLYAYATETWIQRGRASLFLAAPGGTFTRVDFENTSGTTLFGKELGAAGDVNGDGFADFLVTSENMYAAHLFLGAATPAAITRVVIPSPGHLRGTHATGAGDIDGDGYDDVIYGAVYDNRVWVFRGGPAFETVPAWTLTGTGEFGGELAALCDFNNDGCDDFAVTSSGWTAGQYGAVSIFLGGRPFDTTPDFVLTGREVQEGFGQQLRLGGDIDGDGRRDLLVGAPWYNGAATHSGRLDVFYLHPVLGPLAGPSIFGTSTNEFRMIDGNADMDADGIPDIVTAPDVFTGRRFCVYSGADLRRTVSITSDAASRIEDIPASSLTSIADLNGDGRRELLVGNAGDHSLGDGGRARVLAGGHRRFLRLRAESARAPADSTFAVTIRASVASDDPLAQLTLSALDLELAHDPDEILFMGAAPATGTTGWLVAGRAVGPDLTLAATSFAGTTFGTDEQPFLTLHFHAGPVLASTTLRMMAHEAHSSLELPVLLEWDSGLIAVDGTTAAPLPTAAEAMVLAYPNPCNPQARVRWRNPSEGPTELAIYDARGRRLWSRAWPGLPAGEHELTWGGTGDDGRPVGSGTYLLEARGPQWRVRTRITVVR
jgi:hypothetical protein